jgi:hypothetical protein
MCRFSSRNGFSAPNACNLPWLVKGTTQVCTSKKECNKLDQYFWLVDHNDWSRWFPISSPHICGVPNHSFIGGVAKKKAKLRVLILLSRVTYWAPKEGDALRYRFSNFLTNLFIIHDFAKFKVPGEWSVFCGRVLSKQFPFFAFRV